MAFTFDTTPTTTLIDVDYGDGTLDELYTDINNVLVMTKVSQTYNIIGGLCVLRLREGVTLTMEIGNALVWNLSGTLWGSFIVDGGATLIVGYACTLDFESSGYNLSTQYFLGATDFNGTSENPIIVRHSYAIFFRHYAGNAQHDWQYVTVRDGHSGNSQDSTLLWFDSYSGEKPQYNFSNITLTDIVTLHCTPIKFGGGDYSGCTFDNFTIDSTSWGIIGYGSTFKMTNSTIKNILYYGELGPPSGLNYMYSQTADIQPIDTLQQPKIVFDNCTFENNDVVNDVSFYATGSSIVKLKNCTVKDNDIGFLPTANSKFLYQGTTTYTNIDTYNRTSTHSGANYDVNELDLTVEDYSGNVIPNAIVTIKQSQGYEDWTFLTNSNGQIKDCHGDNPVFVKNEVVRDVGDVSWSDSISGGRYHLITIMKEGFQIWHRKVEFTEDVTVMANLQVIGGTILIPGIN